MTDIKEWLLDWFEKNTPAERTYMEENFCLNYFEAGYIDSFEFINLIACVEEEFHISFQQSDFTDRSFSTLAGFLDLILQRKDQ